MLKGQAKKDFEKWLNKNHCEYESNDNYFWVLYAGDGMYIDFYELPFSMKYGVLVDWFDSVGICIEVCRFVPSGSYYFMVNDSEDYTPFETRTQARQKAIEQANKIYNEK
jgi:hypothetical protein